MEPPKRYGEGATTYRGRVRLAGKSRRRGKPTARQRFIDLIAGSEDWLRHRVLDYASQRDYTRYPPTLAEARRLSIASLSASLLEAWQRSHRPPELGPDEDFSQDPIAAFGIQEAKRLQAGGGSLSLFLGLMKCYRQSYLDLVRQAGFEPGLEEQCRFFIDRFFDWVEIGFCTEWGELTATARHGELQAANRTMADAKNQYLTIFESLPNPVIFLDYDNRVSHLNHAAMELLRGFNIPEGVDYGSGGPGDMEAIPFLADDLCAFLAGREPERTVEKSIPTRAGPGFFQIKLQRLTDVSQNFQGTIVILNDITARRQMEEQLELKGCLLDRATDLVYLGELDGALIYCNESAGTQLGYGQEELMGQKIPALLTPEYAGRFEDRVKILQEQGEATFESAYYRKDGSVMPVEVHARLLTLDDRTCILSVSRDISERKAAAAALLGAAQKWRTTFDAIQDAVFVMDREGRIIVANLALADLVQRPFSEIIGRPCYEVLHNAASYIADCPLVRMWESRQREMLVIPAGARWLKAAVDPFLDEAGEVTGAVHIVTDITDAVRADTDLRNSLEKLQRTLTGTVSALASTVETRDPYTSGHQRRVAGLAAAIAQEMGFPPGQVEGMRVIGFLHDIGKIAIPAEILSKPGKISAMEFNLIKDHPQAGHDILKTIECPWPLAQAVLQHHERLDGSGYPLGIKDEDIILEARILMVADVVEAMASHRPYRPALGIDQALAEISRNKRTLYDPGVVAACVRVFTEKGFIFS